MPESFHYRDNFYYKHDCLSKGHVKPVFEELEDIRDKSKQTVRLRCYPSVYLLGMPRCGTTHFFKLVKEFMEGLVVGACKETQYWTRRRFGVFCSKHTSKNKISFQMYM